MHLHTFIALAYPRDTVHLSVINKTKFTGTCRRILLYELSENWVA